MAVSDIVAYYVGLLIIQYANKPKAQGTIGAFATPLLLPQNTSQLIVFSSVPVAGAFTLFYGGDETTSIPYTATSGDVQTALRALPGLSEVTVSGDFTSGFSVLFLGVPPVAPLLVVGDNTLSVTVTITETDETLPLAVQNGYNVTGPSVAQGAQLDILGKYVGVSRTGRGFTAQITLSDFDFLTLIKIAIVKNSAQSDLGTIQQLLFDFFPNQIYAFDFKTMRMSYLISSSVGGQDLVELFISQGLLPVPMAVQLAVIIYAPVIDSFFGFCDYTLPVPLAGQSPLNDYLDYSLESPWLDYANGLFPS